LGSIINKHLCPDDFDLAKRFVEYHDNFGFDVLFSLGLVWDEYVPGSAENWDVEVTCNGDQDAQQRITVVNTPKGELRQVMKISRSSTYLVVLAVEKYLIETQDDFNLFAEYAPPANFIDCGLVQQARDAVGDKGLVNPATHGAFNTLRESLQLLCRLQAMINLFTGCMTTRRRFMTFCSW